jgi:hypothetical protein
MSFSTATLGTHVKCILVPSIALTIASCAGVQTREPSIKVTHQPNGQYLVEVMVYTRPIREIFDVDVKRGFDVMNRKAAELCAGPFEYHTQTVDLAFADNRQQFERLQAVVECSVHNHPN